MSCPRCGKVPPQEASLCSDCQAREAPGATRAPGPAAAPRPYTPAFLARTVLSDPSSPVEAERKFVTVLFADVADFTRIAERLDAEEVHALMDGCFRILLPIVHAFGGTVNQFTGDGVMALFGAPVAHEDSVRRACLASLEIREAMGRYGASVRERVGTDFKIRMGLNAGPVVVGAIGDDLRTDYTAQGDTTNLAARMESLAPSGGILVSRSVYESARRDFLFRPLGKVRVKGKEAPQDVYALLERARPTGAGDGRGIRSALVGREPEMDRLELHVLKAKAGQGSVVSVMGEAGIGKSRIVQEFKKRESMHRVTVLEGRCIAMGRNLSFHPVVQILKGWAGIGEDDAEPLAAHKLEAAVRRIHPAQADEIFPFIATLMGVRPGAGHGRRVEGIEGQALEKLILKSIRDLLVRAASLSTVVIIVEDLHWADNSSIDLLVKLFGLARDHPVVFVNVMRPHYRKTGQRILEAVLETAPGLHAEIYVQPLGAASCDLLIDNLLKTDVPQDIKESIKRHAEGNPLFIEEVLRSFIDEGVVERADGRFSFTRETALVVVPRTLRELLLSRIDMLDGEHPSIKPLLKIASVIGRSFLHRILAHVAGPLPDLDEKLAHLKEVQLIREGRREGEREYLFHHALVQEVVYESILQRRRRALHLKTAEAIETIFADRLQEFCGMLAYHFSRAGQLDKAEEYLVKAGAEALKASASSEALHYFKEAFGIYRSKHAEAADPGKVAMFEKNIALALYNRGQHEEAVAHFDRALATYGAGPPRNRFAAALAFLDGSFHFLVSLFLPFLKFRKVPTDRDREAIDLFYKKGSALVVADPRRFFIDSISSFKIATRFDPRQIKNGIGIAVGTSALFSFTGLSFALSRKVLDLARARMDPADTRARIDYDLQHTNLQYFSGNWRAIRPYDGRMTDEALRNGELFQATAHLYWHGCPALYRGSFSVVEEIVRRLQAVGEEYHNDFSLLVKYFLNTNLLMERGRFRDALQEAEAGIAFLKRTGFERSLIELYACKAWVHLQQGEPREAGEALEHADRIRLEVHPVPIQVSGFHRSRFGYDLHRLEAALRAGDGRAASACGKRTARSGRELLRTSRRAARHLVEAGRLLGAYHWMTGRPRKAARWWGWALQKGESMDARLPVSRLCLDMGRRLTAPGSPCREVAGLRGEAYLERAGRLFREMGLSRDARELDRLRQERSAPPAGASRG